ncbi:hypothetical protein Egran_01400 [Elaphomyces granulatus]|uniref:Protein transport protein SEC9 n=1 Tax=Elaphomyces granulatus TaxID=519963 RepID=A0A232M380_9EURO|nr:hypothetical protein Egran_01400 [Elaphomyces granulatus]
MKKFGLNRSKDGNEDSNRLALFGSKSRSKSPAPEENPYAQPIPNDPYTRAKMNAGVIPPSADPSKRPGDRKGAPAFGGAPDANSGFTPNRYGNQGGYGANKFGDGPASRYGPSGYGGLGSRDPNDADTADENRDALLGGARERLQEQQQTGPPPPYTVGTGPSSGAADGYGGYDGGYANTGTYQERQLTAEQEEEEDVQATKQEIRFIKQGDVSSTRNALRVAAQAEEAGRNTLARLGAQSERILDTEKSLDIASSQNRIAEEKARELKTLNRSMFAVHVSNPFTSSQRQKELDRQVLDTHREERSTREGTRQESFQTTQRMERTFREIEREANKTSGKTKKNLSERAKYQFEADSEDETMEDEIEQNLDLLSGAAGRLNGLARATGDELDKHNKHLERITGKSDYVDDQITMNRSKLDRIRG